MIDLIILLFYNILMINGDICNNINGRYNVAEDRIELCVKSKSTLAHEIGHRFYWAKMSKKERQIWDKLSSKYKDRKYFISDYAMKNESEDFAETFMHIYLNKDFKYQHKMVKLKRQYILYLINKKLH